jgi:hypothetical protein
MAMSARGSTKDWPRRDEEGGVEGEAGIDQTVGNIEHRTLNVER